MNSRVAFYVRDESLHSKASRPKQKDKSSSAHGRKYPIIFEDVSFMATSATDPHQLEELFNYCTGFAKQMIDGHGEFHPFGAVIAADGQLIAVGADIGEEFPKGAELYAFLQRSMRSQFLKREIIACAIAANVDVPTQFRAPFADGIRVSLECAGYSRFIYLPYRASNGRVDYGDLISVDVPAAVCS